MGIVPFRRKTGPEICSHLPPLDSLLGKSLDYLSAKSKAHLDFRLGNQDGSRTRLESVA